MLKASVWSQRLKLICDELLPNCCLEKHLAAPQLGWQLGTRLSGALQVNTLLMIRVAMMANIRLKPGLRQGLTLVHFSAQRERFLWDRGCIQGLLMGCKGGVGGFQGVSRVYFVSQTAQVELRSGRV